MTQRGRVAFIVTRFVVPLVLGFIVALTAGVAADRVISPKPEYPRELEPGWIWVDCEPWPGGEGPCWAPPDQVTPERYDCSVEPCRIRVAS